MKNQELKHNCVKVHHKQLIGNTFSNDFH